MLNLTDKQERWLVASMMIFAIVVFIAISAAILTGRWRPPFVDETTYRAKLSEFRRDFVRFDSDVPGSSSAIYAALKKEASKRKRGASALVLLQKEPEKGVTGLLFDKQGDVPRIMEAAKTEIVERSSGVPSESRAGRKIFIDRLRVSEVSDVHLAEVYDKAEKTLLVMARALREGSQEFKTPGELRKDLSVAKTAADVLNMEDMGKKLAKMKNTEEIRAFLKRIEQEIGDAERFAEEISSEEKESGR